ncbi:hypothetical protein [Lachnospira multipara]|uniref:hypothetical protein n=1 Tax=Lachnospira multipara TaxID=28051 RepID=UPI00047F0202|nr:hypothetical protein [Lachnospira multipara]
MDGYIIMIGVILLVIILVRSCIYFEKTKFIHIMNHPEMIQEMEKVSLLLKIRVWSQYGRYVGNHVNEKELRMQEELLLYRYWASDVLQSVFLKRNIDINYLKKTEEYVNSLTYTYRMLWIKILLSKTHNKLRSNYIK